MAQVTLQVIVQDQQVTQLQQRIDALDNRRITLQVDETGLRNMNTRLTNAVTRTNNLTQAQQNLQNALHQTNQQFEQGTQDIENNTEALNRNRNAGRQNQQQQRQNHRDMQQHNRDLHQQGVLYDILGRSLGSFLARMAAYRAVYAGIRAITQGFTEALQTLKAVDDELVTVRKVTGFDAYQMEGVEAQAYAVASRYGASASDYVSGVAEFARAGYKELSGDLAELAQKTQIVGDTTADVANQFLLSVDAAYKYEGSVSKLNAVLDGANEIDNKYATSIKKIAEGMGIVAPVAAQMHVGIDELAASIGTITAVTQRTGTETARALRALFLNIVGDTKTEIDEGVTWTTGEIEGLKDIIKVYAKEAYDAAQATGSIIDPMKAMEGLSKSLKDGLLSEQELMEMVSDIGGKLRTSQLLALINNWDMYESMLEDYRNAAGSADKEIENAMDSWSRKTNVLKNTWTEFIKTDLNSGLFKWFLDALTWIVERFDSLYGVLARLILLTAAFRLDRIATGLGNIAESVRNLFTAFNGLGGVLAGIAVAWGVVSFAVESHKRALEEAREETEESIKATQSDLKMLDDLKTRYLEIVDSTATAAEKDKQLAEFKKQLIEQYGFEKKAVEQINLERKTGIDLLNQEAEASLRRTLSENKETFDRAANVYHGTTDTESFWYYFGESLPIKEMERFGAVLVSNEEGLSKVVVSGENLRETYDNLGGVISVLEKKQLSRNGLTYEEEELLNDLRARYHELGIQMDQYGSIYEDGIKLQAQYILMSEGVSAKTIQSKDAFDGLKRTLQATYGADKDLWEAMSLLLNEMFPSFQEEVEETTDAVEGETKSFWANTAALEADADSTKRLQAAKADAEAAARNLIPVLFDENGELTSVGQAALESSDYLADLVEAELTLQNEIAKANYANLRAQLAAVSTDALRAATTLIAAYEAAQTARNMGYSVGNMGYDRNHVPAGTFSAVNILRQLQEIQNQINATSVSASAVGTYGTGARTSSGRSSGGRSSGSSGGRTSSSSSSSTSTEDEKLKKLKDRVALLKSELELLKAQGAGEDELIAKMQQIMSALQAQANYMTSIGDSQVEINGLMTDYYNYQNQIDDMRKEEEDTTDHELEALQEKVELLKSEASVLDAQDASLEDRIAKQREIADAIMDEIKYLQSTGASQIDINNLLAEYYNILKDIQEMEKDPNQEGLERSQRQIELLKTELALSEARGDGEERRLEILHRLRDSYYQEVAWLRASGASQEEINRALTEYYNICNDIQEIMSKDHELENIQERMELLKSELSILEQNGSSNQQRITKIREIMDLLHEEAEHLREIGASETEINGLSAEWWRYHNEIERIMEEEANEAERQADALERAQRAQEALNNALRQRNVHIYNAATGRWEWVANPSAVQSAQNALDEAMSGLPEGAMLSLPSAGKSINTKNMISNVHGGTNNYGATYNIGGVNISESDARAMSVYDLLQLSKTLGIFNKTG